MMISRFLTAFAITASIAYAQWTGTGFNPAKSDGAVVIAANDARVIGGVFTWNPVRDGWDADGDNVYHFASFRIDAGVRVRVRADRMRSPGPMVMLVQGAVEIRGTLDLSGNDGAACGDIGNRAPTTPGPGGFPGGVGALGANPAQRGFGPGGSAFITTFQGGLFQCPANHSGAGYYVGGGDAYGAPYFACNNGPYGNSFLVPLIGGSGGAGALNNSAGGAGGGAIRISSDVSITIGSTTSDDGAILARGGAATGCSPAGLGGAGSGGAVHLQAPAIQTGTRSAHGISTAGASAGISFNPSTASAGRIRIDSNSLTGIGNLVPPPTTGPLVNVPLPAPPAIQIASIDGIAVTASPTGAYLLPDVVINKTTPVAVVVNGQNIPPGTPINLFLSTDVGGTDAIISATLAGTLASSTVSVSVTLPTGVHRIYVRATW